MYFPAVLSQAHGPGGAEDHLRGLLCQGPRSPLSGRGLFSQRSISIHYLLVRPALFLKIEFWIHVTDMISEKSRSSHCGSVG